MSDPFAGLALRLARGRMGESVDYAAKATGLVTTGLRVLVKSRLVADEAGGVKVQPDALDLEIPMALLPARPAEGDALARSADRGGGTFKVGQKAAPDALGASWLVRAHKA